MREYYVCTTCAEEVLEDDRVYNETTDEYECPTCGDVLITCEENDYEADRQDRERNEEIERGIL